MRKELHINETKLNYIRKYLIEKIFRNSDIMNNEEIRDTDLIEIIATLYEYLHILITNDSYDYFFHWANKCGSWVETDYFDRLITKIIEDEMKEEGLTP